MKRVWVWALAVLGIVTTIVILLVLISDYQANRNAEKLAQTHLNQGIHLYQQGTLPEAQVLLRSVIKTGYSDWRGPYYMGIIKIQLKQYHLAIPYLEQALIMNPEEVKITNSLGVAYFKLDQLDMAKAYFAASLELDPDNLDAKSLYQNMAKLQRRAELVATEQEDKTTVSQ